MLSLPFSIIGQLKTSSISLDIFPMNKQINGFLLQGRHIAINQNISWYEQRFAVCHELSHAVLGHNFEDKWIEREADDHAFQMLVSDHELMDLLEHYEGDTIMMEKHLGVSAERIQKRLKKIKV